VTSVRKARIIATLGGPALRLLAHTWRVTFEGEEHETKCRDAGTPYLWAFRHGRLLLAAWACRGRGIGVMVSQHGDGEIIAQLAAKLGYETYRGSTTRGGNQALREMSRVPGSQPLAITPDGPRGPDGSVQPGVVLLAQATERVVIPAGLAAVPAWRARSWDRLVVPKPFARIRVVYREPIRVPAELDRAGREQWAERIRAEMEEAERIAWERLRR
jgi:hypothetical protein